MLLFNHRIASRASQVFKLRSLNKRQYNLDVYGHKRGRYTGRYSLCGVCITCRACGYSLDPIRTHGCFLSHAARPHAERLAMVDHIVCFERDCGHSRSVRSACCGPIVRPGARPNDCTYNSSPPDCDIDPAARGDKSTICNADSSSRSDSSCNIRHASIPDGY